MTTPTRLIETDYEVKLGVFEGPLDLLLYLVQKNELDPRQIQIAVITDQYLAYIDRIKDMNLSNAGEFLVMASRLMRLKARELLPADQKDDLEEMEYELDRQALIQQMLEYQKFKEAARVLRTHESRHFGAYGRGRSETPDEKNEAELEEEAGVFDLLAAFRNVVMSRPKIPVHEVEIDDVTIEDRMQEVEITLNERGRSLFEDLFVNDTRTISLVVTFMSILELAKLDRIVFRQSHAMGPIWVYRKAKSSDYEMELKHDESHLEPLPEFKEGLVDIIKEQIKQRAVANALEEALRDLEMGIIPGEGPSASAPAATPADAAQNATAPVPAAEAAVTVAETVPSGQATSAPGDGAAEADSESGSASEDLEETAVESTPAEEAHAEDAEDATPESAASGHPIVEPDNPESEAIAEAVMKDLMERMRNAPEEAIPEESPEDEE
jgi:chromatin segregation and condensation protein Rec8/ScpA/Scc1 (kleisin family)